MIDGDERDAVLHQPPGHQAALAEPIAAIAIAQLVLLSRQVEGLFRVAQDHAVGFFIQGVGRLEQRLLVDLPGQRVDASAATASPLHAFVGHAAGRHDVLDAEILELGSPPVAKVLYFCPGIPSRNTAHGIR